MNIPLVIYTPSEFFEKLNIEFPVFWIYYGLLISMILYNLFLIISVRDINFLYYVLGAGALRKIMTRKNKYRVDEVLRSLSKKHDVRINGTDILVLNGKSKKKPKQYDLGNGSWGKIEL